MRISRLPGRSSKNVPLSLASEPRVNERWMVCAGTSLVASVVTGVGTPKGQPEHSQHDGGDDPNAHRFEGPAGSARDAARGHHQQLPVARSRRPSMLKKLRKHCPWCSFRPRNPSISAGVENPGEQLLLESDSWAYCMRKRPWLLPTTLPRNRSPDSSSGNSMLSSSPNANDAPTSAASPLVERSAVVPSMASPPT